MKTVVNSSNKSLFFFTSSYPFGKTETFIENEIVYLSLSFKKVYLIPVSKSDEIRVVPSNCEVIDVSYSNEGYSSKKVILKYPFLLVKLFLKELYFNRSFIKNKRSLFSDCMRMVYKSIKLEEALKDYQCENAVFYSYWMNNWTTLLSIIKSVKKIPNLYTRVHGFDLYEQNRPQKYIPFRNFQLKYCSEVYSVSKEGQDYLKTKYPVYSNKIKKSYLGTNDLGINEFVPDVGLHIVSVSNFIPLKRIHLIVEELMNVEVDLKWTHFGDGKLMEEIILLSDALPTNIKVDFKGRRSNQELLSFMKETQVSFIINVSKTEGLPVSIMEAISFGIPAIATNVGGTAEIVNEETGILIDENFETGDISVYLNDFYNSKFSAQKFREGVRNFWLNNFNAKINYNSFIREIIK